MKRFVAVFLSVALVLLLTVPGIAESVKKSIEVTYNNIQLVVDGTTITPKDATGNIVEPFIYNGTTYLPVRAVGEALGKTVEWDAATQTVYLGEKPAAAEPTPEPVAVAGEKSVSYHNITFMLDSKYEAALDPEKDKISITFEAGKAMMTMYSMNNDDDPETLALLTRKMIVDTVIDAFGEVENKSEVSNVDLHGTPMNSAFAVVTMGGKKLLLNVDVFNDAEYYYIVTLMLDSSKDADAGLDAYKKLMESITMQ